MAILAVDGTNLPAPSAMKISILEVSAKAERTASGRAVIDRIAEKRRIELKWAYLTGSNLSALLSAVGTDAFFSLTYPDPVTAAARTMVCACTDRQMGVLRMIDGAPVWTDVEMTLEER